MAPLVLYESIGYYPTNAYSCFIFKF